MGTLDAKVALVTGGASGIGLATAERLAGEGASLVVLDRDAVGAGAAADRLGGSALEADVADPAAWARVVTEVEEAFGRLDVAFLNAGVTTGEADITRLTDDQYRRITGANMDGVVFGVRAVVPLMEAAGGGAIVATSSLAGLIAFSPDPVYTLTKHAVVGLVRALAPQLAERSITVNAICPSLVDTPLLGSDAVAGLEAAGFPLIDPAAIADAVIGRVLGSETGEAWVCQAGLEPVSYRFAGVPGPRQAGAEGRLPPPSLTAHDQIR